MNREEFNNLIWLIGQVAEIPEFEIIGSNAIHAHLPPEKVTGPLAVSADLDALLDRIRKWDSVLRSLGPLSTYAKEKHVWVDVVSEHTARYPAGWRERQIPIRVPFEPSPIAWCPDLTDMAAAKMGAFRPQDKAFVAELLRIGELEPDLLIERIRLVERVDRTTLDKAVEWVSRRRMPAPDFRILPPVGPQRPLVAHVPHASVVIPADVRAGLLLDDTALGRELVRVTDWHVDRLLAWVPDAGGTLLVNETSRLVVDPERFPDDADEPMAAAGQGAVYTRTTAGRPLRLPDEGERARLLAHYFEPYHAALTGLVTNALERFDACLLLDGHSFATEPLPSEADQSADRPDVCIGTDSFHTPPALATALHEALEAEGFRTELDRPFAGSLVPLAFYRRDPRVTSLMIEVRRGLYCDEGTGAPNVDFHAVAARLGRAVRRAIARQ